MRLELILDEYLALPRLAPIAKLGWQEIALCDLNACGRRGRIGAFLAGKTRSSPEVWFEDIVTDLRWYRFLASRSPEPRSGYSL